MGCEMKDFLSFKKVGKNGYLMVPRNLLEEVFSMDKPFTEAQAYLYLYMKASFCNRKGKMPLKRGQLTFKTSDMAKRFNWKVYTLREFLHTLHKEGVIVLEQMPGVGQKVTMCFYEVLATGREKPTSESEQADFNEFWKQYYSLLDRQGYDLYAALSEWEKLTEEEKRLAVQNMVPYFESLTDIRFVKTACNYLRFKVYLRPENVEKMHKNQ